MPKPILDLTVCLRFGILGIGASHYVLKRASNSERISLLSELRRFGTMIREHLEENRISEYSHQISPGCSRQAQEIYGELFDRYVTLSNLNGPLDLVLSILVEEFVQKHSAQCGKRLILFRNRRLERAFDVQAQRSLQFALNFVERRSYDLEELPEIALIGE
jgi:hypothetical protein